MKFDSATVNMRKLYDLYDQTTASLVARPLILQKSLDAARDIACIQKIPDAAYEPTDYSYELTKPARIIPIWFSLWLNGTKE